MSLRALRPLGSLLVIAAGWAASATVADELPFLEYARIDPSQVMRAESCGECHTSEYAVWEETPHAEGFRSLHRRPRAENIASKLGFRLIKRQSFCYTCHYTPEIDDDQIRVVSGVSCESCHGAGRDWIRVHNNYGSAADHRGESAENRRRRIERSRAAGMRRPSDLYPVVANCFSCHTVPNERLVNVGGHNTGSSTFEFVEWSQGDIRHNFLDSFLRGGDPVNAERPLSRKRSMYVVGRALDLEYSLRGMAEATKNGIYSKSMSRRVRSALSEVRAIAASVELPAVEAMVEAVRDVKVVPGNREALLAAAERIGAATRSFLQRADTNLAALDPLLLGTGAPTELEEPAVAAADPGAPTVATPGSSGAAPEAPGAAPRDGTTRPSAATGVEGRFKRKIRPASSHRTLGPAACAGCHAEQNKWWFEHPHFRAADPFFDGERQNLQIARLYGLSPAQMTRGDQACMDCHGSVISGKEARDVLDGVGCEACHGPAADWLEPHKVEGGAGGASRPGYLAALERGKNDLKKVSVRAETCTGCHYITEPRLLSAGHPSGADFDYVAGMAEVRHWKAPLIAGAQLTAAFDSALAARGPVPRVRVATAGAGGELESGSSGTARATTGRAPGTTVERPALTSTRVVRARPFAAGVSAGEVGADVGLGEFPEIDDSTPVEDVLLLLRERLRALYRSLGTQEGPGR